MTGTSVANLLLLAAYLALPVVAFLRLRSLMWTTILVLGATSLAGAGVGFGIELGYRWSLPQLQVVLALALLLAAAAAWLKKSPGSTPIRWQMWSVALPVGVLLAFFALARLIARDSAGGLTAVGYFVDHVSSEDNAKWLDFTGQLVTGAPIDQAVYLGGPLQLFLVFVATALAVISSLLLGGVNEVFVAANAVVYGQFILAALTPLALAPLAEARLPGRISGTREQSRSQIPAPILWSGMLILATATTAVINLGHFTLQWVLLVATLWVTTFVVQGRGRHAALITSVVMVVAATVWFPLVPVALVVMGGYLVWFVVQLAGRESGRRLDPWGWTLWVLTAVLLSLPLYHSVLYLTDQPAGAVALGGAARGVVALAIVPALDLLTSQGGTEATSAILAILAAASAVMAGMVVARWRWKDSRYRLVTRYAPALLLITYALGLSVVGTWWAGTGPDYGGVKVTFMVSIVIASASVPLAIVWINPRRARMGTVAWIAVIGVVYLMTIDTLLPRAMAISSPQRWPSTQTDPEVFGSANYWRPAEVRPTADQPIASSPIACAYFPQGSFGPTALPNGQTTYNCTRLLAGLSGADREAQPLVDWQRREWLTNTNSWTAVWPVLIDMPDEILSKNIILLDEGNNVIGLESVRTMLDRFRPEWAQGGDLSEYQAAP